MVHIIVRCYYTTKYIYIYIYIYVYIYMYIYIEREREKAYYRNINNI